MLCHVGSKWYMMSIDVYARSQYSRPFANTSEGQTRLLGRTNRPISHLPLPDTRVYCSPPYTQGHNPAYRAQHPMVRPMVPIRGYRHGMLSILDSQLQMSKSKHSRKVRWLTKVTTAGPFHRWQIGSSSDL
jgi:hypothetical protein